MSEVKVNKITPTAACGTVTLGDSGDTISIPAGVTLDLQGTSSGITSITWDTTAKTTGFTAVAGNGYFVNTTSGAITVTLPASPSAGDYVAIKDYANTADTNNITIGRNGEPIQGVANDFIINAEGASVTLFYVDGTQGWMTVSDSIPTDVQNIQYVTATGGTITLCGDYKIHTFTGPGTFCVSCAGSTAGSNSVSYVVVAGGGGGGGNTGGGGGAGQVSTSTTQPVSATAYPITVGGGGAAGPGPAPGPAPGSTPPATTGSTSNFGPIVTASAGTGGLGAPGNSAPGGTSGSGNAGGSGAYPSSGAGGGGGGQGAVGSAGGTGSGPGAGKGGAGGVGIDVTPIIDVTPNHAPGFYGGGGAGGPFGDAQPNIPGGKPGGGAATNQWNPPNGVTPGIAGDANTGGGGSGGSAYAAPGGTGGSGVVVIKYKYQN